MMTDKEQIKEKIYKSIPDLLPKLFKTVVVHIIMMIYHISMPPWVTAMKIKKGLKSNENTEKDLETGGRMRRRRTRRSKRRHI